MFPVTFLQLHKKLFHQATFSIYSSSLSVTTLPTKMAEQHPQGHPNNTFPVSSPPEETTDHGCFDFIMRKKEPIAKPQEHDDDLVAVTDLNAGHEQKRTLMDELHRTNTHSTSSSEEEVEEGGERKRRKKKGPKDAITENKGVDGHKQEDIELHDVEKFNEEENAKTIHSHPDYENKGFIETMKDKLHVPDQHTTSSEEEDTPTPPPPYEHSSGGDMKEKKGIIEKIKERLPGGNHKSNGNEVMKED